MSSPEEKTDILIGSSVRNCDAYVQYSEYGSIGNIHRKNNFKVYKRRWYILAVFFICSAVNGMKWNTWGPIQGTSQVVFDWSNTTITLLVAWGPIVYIIVFLPVSWLMDVKGKNVTPVYSAYKIAGSQSYV